MKQTSQTDSDPSKDIYLDLGIDGSRSGKKHLKWWFVWIGVALLIPLAALKWNQSAASTMVDYHTQKVRQGDIIIMVNATGTLEPTNQIDIGSELSGIIKTVSVDYNDRVKVGQILARLDTSKLEAAVQQYRAALKSAEANVLQARATVSETENKLKQIQKAWELSHQKVPSRSDLDAAEAAFQRAKADEASARAVVLEARATLEVNEADLSKAAVRSPINGIVLTRSVDPGQTVAASLEAPVLFTLAEDLAQMELHVDVDEADVSQVAEGQPATFTVDAYPDRTFPASIRQVRFGAQSTDEGVVTYETVLDVDNSGLLLRPGMTATADITVKKIENTLLVPNAALRFSPPAAETEKKETNSDSGGIISKLFPRPPHRKKSSKQSTNGNAKNKEHLVWALNDGRLFSIPVTIGETDGTMTQIISGALEPGTPLVIDAVRIGK